MANDKPKKSKKDIWYKFGRFITGVTIACFFLPFFGVSCQGLDVITFSGADMVGGCKPGGLASEAEDQAKGMGDMPRDSSDAMPAELKHTPREPLAIAALALALVVAGLSWVRSRGAMIGALVLSIACIGALAGLYIKVGGEMKEGVEAQIRKESKGSAGMSKEAQIDSGGRFGLWLTVAGLLGAAVMTGLALKEKEGFAAAMPPPALPPGAPPPGGGYPPA